MQISLYAMAAEWPPFCQAARITSSQLCQTQAINSNETAANTLRSGPTQLHRSGYRLNQIENIAAYFRALISENVRTSWAPSGLDRNSIISNEPDGLTVPALPASLRGHIVKEKLNRDIENTRHVVQSAGADAIGAFFVFLYLLKGQIETFTKFFLAHSDQHSPHPQPAANMNINRIWHFYCHQFHLSRTSVAKWQKLPAHATVSIWLFSASKRHTVVQLFSRGIDANMCCRFTPTDQFSCPSGTQNFFIRLQIK